MKSLIVFLILLTFVTILALVLNANYPVGEHNFIAYIFTYLMSVFGSASIALAFAGLESE